MNGSFSDLADRLPATMVFVAVGPEGGHRRSVGGVTVLERVLRGLAREGVVVARVAAPAIELGAGVPLEVEWAGPDGVAPEGWRVVRGDELMGRRIVDEAERVAAEWALCRGLTTSYQGVFDTLINGTLSVPISRLLSYTPVRPNHVTAVASVIGLTAGGLLLGGEAWRVALGGLLLQTQIVLDCVDGQLARMRFQGSKFGQWFDNVADDVIDITFIACAGAALGGPWLAVGLAAGVARAWGQALVFHEVYRRTGTGDVFSFRIWFEREQASADEVFDRRGLGSYVRALGRRDGYVFVWMLLCLAGQLEAVVVYGAVLSAMIGVLMTLHLFLRKPLPRRA
jgi:phosphatidylglycerophosphate synthase